MKDYEAVLDPLNRTIPINPIASLNDGSSVLATLRVDSDKT